MSSGDVCRCGWRRRPAGRCQPGPSGAGELRAQNLARAFSQIGGSIEAREKRRQLTLSCGIRSAAIENRDVESLPRLHAVAAKLGRQLSVIAWHDQVPLVGCIGAAHAQRVAVSGCSEWRHDSWRISCAARPASRRPRACPQPLEEQLIDWLQDFQPDQALRQLVLDTIQAQAGTRPGEDAERRRQLTSQLERLRDLYVMGDLTKPEYVMRRQALEEELQRTKPPTNPDLDRAAAILEDFTRFWDAEPEPAERRKLVLPVRAGMAEGRPDRRRQTPPRLRQLLHRRVGGASDTPKNRRRR
jgi:hypothetical protein